MKNSVRVARLFGIDIDIHVTFFILPLASGLLYARRYDLASGFHAFWLIIFIFLCVLGHELCHSLVAKKYGIGVPRITLYLIGGVASMHRIPRRAGQEFMISLAGPLFNFILALASYGPLLFLIGPENLYHPSLDSWQGTLANLFWINPVLGLFNLIPAFPMDGGRMLRSALALRLNYLNATRISVYLGYLFAILFLLFGIWKQHWILAFISYFVFVSARDELSAVKRSYE